MVKFHCYIPVIRYFNATHALTVIFLEGKRLVYPLWMGYIIDAQSQHVLDVRWHGKLPDEQAVVIDKWCLQCSGQLVDNCLPPLGIEAPFRSAVSV